MTHASPATFTLEPVPEVPLARAPLAKVLTQVQFSRTPGLVSDSAEQQLAERLTRYPVRRQATAGGFSINLVAGVPQAPVQAPPSPVLLFTDRANDWQATINETSVSLETTAYDSRKDFCERVHEVLHAVSLIAEPPVVDRVGVRYIDRLQGESLTNVESYVIPPLRTLIGSVDPKLELQHSVNDSMIVLNNDERLQAKSGLLPPSGAFDPAIDPVPEKSWLLDIDVFTVRGGIAFDIDQLTERIRRYSQYVYSYFRFATTDEFVREFKD